MTSGQRGTVARCRRAKLTDPSAELKRAYILGQLDGGRRDDADEADLIVTLTRLCPARTGAGI